MKTARIHAKNNMIFIQAFSKTTIGYRILSGPVFKVPFTDISNIGYAVLRVFDECRENVLDEPNNDQDTKNDPMLLATGDKTWNSLMKSSKAVSLYFDNNIIKFEPNHFGGISGPNKGYHSIHDKTIFSDLNPQHIGQAVLKALEACE